jgi:hypothetical protein
MRCGIIDVEGGSANENGHKIYQCDDRDGNINYGNVTIKTMPAAIKQKECRWKARFLVWAVAVLGPCHSARAPRQSLVITASSAAWLLNE